MRARSIGAEDGTLSLTSRFDVGFEAVGAVLGMRSLRLGRLALSRLVVHETVSNERRVCHVHVVLLLLVDLGSRSSRGEGEEGVDVLVKCVNRAEKVSATDRSHL